MEGNETPQPVQEIQPPQETNTTSIAEKIKRFFGSKAPEQPNPQIQIAKLEEQRKQLEAFASHWSTRDPRDRAQIEKITHEIEELKRH
jgi:hypothetical protein